MESMEEKKSAKGRIVFIGRIRNLSPLHIGCGSDDRSDLDVLRDENGKPFIPATSFTGILKHAIESSANSDYKKYSKYAKKFWGFSEDKDGHQSIFRCADLVCQKNFQEQNIVIRDGIRIDNRAGMVRDKGKYDYEIVEPGTAFDLKMEFAYERTEPDKKEEEFVRRMVGTIHFLLKNRHIQLGAKTNSGLGEIKLLENKTKVYEFDFSDKKDVIRWLTRSFSQAKSASLGTSFEINHRLFTIKAKFRLKNSLIIRSYSEDPEMPDAVHIKSLDKPVLTGTSLKGAIRARAERIVRTIGKSESIITNLFGNVDDENRSQNAQKGRIQIRESVLSDFISELQTRIKIDRFTSGTIETALFDTMPLWSEHDKIVNIEICVQKYKDYEAGLLLLILKDLWTGDLAVGGEKNVGRGVFQGVKAIIQCNNNEPIIIENDLNKLDHEIKATLQDYVKALTHYRHDEKSND
ncbi:RAMP superfamily CRISPR-associated protein [Desulfococcaceae bacterium HSG8]|nr:RAMP superfamily CRISPR-associated protein [Desulfococcaceae bacterium HSG8]